MVNVKVKNGTPLAGPHLCRNCNWGQYTLGYRESDLLVICTNSNPARLVPFAVRECTDYEDRNRPGWEQMEKLAINVTPDPLKPVGFKTGSGSRVSHEDLE